jgi:hypothetical protein
MKKYPETPPNTASGNINIIPETTLVIKLVSFIVSLLSLSVLKDTEYIAPTGIVVYEKHLLIVLM